MMIVCPRPDLQVGSIVCLVDSTEEDLTARGKMKSLSEG